MRSSIEQSAEIQRLLTFTLDGQLYGVDLFRIREIRAYTLSTPTPNVNLEKLPQDDEIAELVPPVTAQFA